MPTKEKGAMYQERSVIIVNRKTSMPGDFMDMKAWKDRPNLLAKASKRLTDGEISLLLNHQRCRHIKYDHCKTISI